MILEYEPSSEPLHIDAKQLPVFARGQAQLPAASPAAMPATYSGVKVLGFRFWGVGSGF